MSVNDDMSHATLLAMREARLARDTQGRGPVAGLGGQYPEMFKGKHRYGSYVEYDSRGPIPTIPSPPTERIAWLSHDDTICTRNADGGVTAWSRNDAEALFHLLDGLLDDQQKRSDAQEQPAP